jgi:hypothetical protein
MTASFSSSARELGDAVTGLMTDTTSSSGTIIS